MIGTVEVEVVIDGEPGIMLMPVRKVTMAEGKIYFHADQYVECAVGIRPGPQELVIRGIDQQAIGVFPTWFKGEDFAKSGTITVVLPLALIAVESAVPQ